MEKEFNTIIEKVKDISMTADEKSVVLNKLVEFIDAHPIKASTPNVSHESFLAPTPSPFFSRLAFSPAFRIAALILVVAIAGTGSISFAAASALPGDLLYRAKINFNEPIASALKLTPEAKAQYAESRVEARLAEAQTLIDRGAFAGTRGKEADTQIDLHMERALERIDAVPAAKRGALTRTADEILLPRIARHRALVLGITAPSPLDTITSGRPESENTTTGATAAPSAPTPPTGAVNGVSPVVIPTPTAPVSPTDTEAQFVTLADQNLTAVGIKLSELRTLRPERDDIRAKLDERIRQIELVVKEARLSFVAKEYRDSIAHSHKALQMIQNTNDAIRTLMKDSGSGTSLAPAGTGATQ